MSSPKRPHPASSQSTAAIIESAMTAMTNTEKPALFDVTIICTTDDFQATYWMDRLSKGICKSDSPNTVYPMVLAVSEDWNGSGGAGNGLGTLYGMQKACRIAKEKYNVDLAEELKAGKVSAALYHTAGKGTRLAPLPASENNNKPGVVRYLLNCVCFFVMRQLGDACVVCVLQPFYWGCAYHHDLTMYCVNECEFHHCLFEKI